MKTYFWSHLSRLLPTFLNLNRAYKRQRAYGDHYLSPYLHQKSPNGESLAAADIRRMRDYPLLFIVYFNEIICQLWNCPLSEPDREKITLFSAGLCLYDDFFDKERMEEKRLEGLIRHPERFKTKTLKEEVCAQLWTKLYQLYPANEQYWQVFDRFHQAQLESRLQLGKKLLAKEEIRAISFAKGGGALLLSRLLMDQPLVSDEADAIWQTGAWFQLLDDTVDVAKDYEEGVQTLLTRSEKLEEMEEELTSQTCSAFGAIRALNYPKAARDRALFFFHVIGTSAWIHLHRLRRLQKQTNGSFKLSEYPLSEITWREDRPSNYYLALGYILGRRF